MELCLDNCVRQTCLQMGNACQEQPSGHLQGSVVIRTSQQRIVKYLEDGTPVKREFSEPLVCHDDIIGRHFWETHPEILKSS